LDDAGLGASSPLLPSISSCIVVCVWANCRSLVELESVSHDSKNTENLCNHPKEAETGNCSRENELLSYMNSKMQLT
jgi:hypothetical protein